MPVYGIDVSKWQGQINWAQIAQDVVGPNGEKIEFAFVKATEGSDGTGVSDPSAIAAFAEDPDFHANAAGARAAGLIVGFYHFGRPDLGNSAVAEAAWFVSRVRGLIQPTDLIALDLEVQGGNYDAWTAEWLAFVKAQLGFEPLFYTYQTYFAAHGISFAGIGGQAGLWEAAPSSSTIPAPLAGWGFVAFWQAHGRRIAGDQSATTDLDVFNGDINELRKYGKPGLAGGVVQPIAPTYTAIGGPGLPAPYSVKIASGTDEATVETAAVAWQQANLTISALITKDGQPFKTLPAIPRPVGRPLPDPNEGNRPSNIPPAQTGGKPVAVNAPNNAADLSALEEELLNMVANGKDGVEAGFTTTEFWLSVIAVAIDYLDPQLASVPAVVKMAAASAIVATYAALRTWRKNNGPAKLVAQIAALRKELFG